MAKIPVTIFIRPNARQENVQANVDDATADIAMSILSSTERGRFTLEDIGGGDASVCLEGIGNDDEVDDIFIEIYSRNDHPNGLPWDDFMTKCAQAIGIMAQPA